MSVLTAVLADRSVRVKVLAPVLLAAAGIGGVAWSGVAGVTAAGTRTHAMYEHTARPLGDLVSLRDMQGDSRVEVRDVIILKPGKAQEEVVSGMKETDASADDAIAAYVADHGTLDASRSALIAQARAGLQQWRTARDKQLVPLVRAGKAGAAAALLADGGTLAKANSSFGEALDTLADSEGTEAQRAIDTVDAEQQRERTTMVIISLVIITAAVLVGLLVARAVVRPLLKVRAVLIRQADGDLTGDPEVTSRDEVGQMAAALASANTALRRTVSTIVSAATTLGEAADQLAVSSGHMSERASDSAGQAAVVSGDADSASQSIMTVSEAATEMGAAINEIAQRAGQAAAAAGDAVEVVAGTSATVEQLGRSSADIEQVLNAITSIAAQTNLLALNATIEAARAGEAGKGFAVVAGEVKDLAQQTSAATEDIARRITAIQTTSADASSAISRIGAVIDEINDHQAAIAAAVEEQTATTGEMSRSVAQAAGASTRIAETITSVADAARSTESDVTESQQVISTVTRLSSDLQRLVKDFRY